jgi:hypothetical protein
MDLALARAAPGVGGLSLHEVPIDKRYRLMARFRGHRRNPNDLGSVHINLRKDRKTVTVARLVSVA